MTAAINKLLRFKAAERGDKRFYSSKPCKNCSNYERYVINCACVQCAITRGKKVTTEIKVKKRLVANLRQASVVVHQDDYQAVLDFAKSLRAARNNKAIAPST